MQRHELWALTQKAMIGVGVIFLNALAGALINGEPLKGLAKVSVLWRALNGRMVPTWLFALVLLVAIYVIQSWFALSHEYRRALHVVWHPEKCFWHMGTVGGKPAMQVFAEATFTNVEEGDIQIIRAGVSGGNTAFNLLRPIICSFKAPNRENFVFFVEPPLSGQGNPWRGRVVLIDQYNRSHRSPKLTFVYH
jgi:hypothetical protein